jgi:hypothetical protein
MLRATLRYVSAQSRSLWSSAYSSCLGIGRASFSAAAISHGSLLLFCEGIRFHLIRAESFGFNGRAVQGHQVAKLPERYAKPRSGLRPIAARCTQYVGRVGLRGD